MLRPIILILASKLVLHMKYVLLIQRREQMKNSVYKLHLVFLHICILLMSACSCNNEISILNDDVIGTVTNVVSSEECSNISTNSALETTGNSFESEQHETSKTSSEDINGIKPEDLNTPYIEYTSDDELFCRYYPGVYKAYENIFSDKNVDNNIELAISQLMDKNMICIYTYFTTALFQIQEPDESSEDGYLLVEFRFFNNLSEFYKLVESTYTEPISNKLIEGYINLGEPTFVERNGSVMYNPNYTGLTTGPYFSELGYKIEIIEQSDSLCKFLYTPLFETISDERRNELEKYWGDDMMPHECEAVFENGEWKLNDIIFAF